MQHASKPSSACGIKETATAAQTHMGRQITTFSYNGAALQPRQKKRDFSNTVKQCGFQHFSMNVSIIKSVCLVRVMSSRLLHGCKDIHGGEETGRASLSVAWAYSIW